MNKICKYIYSKGDNVICSFKDEILGDIMGYDGKKCECCKHVDKVKKSTRKK